MRSQDPPSSPLIQVRGLSKRFPGVVALDGVELSLNAVIGENGAGKSTLMKILAGVQPADEGQILINGQQAHIRTVEDAMSHGIALIHQELNLADNLDVAANIYLGREPRRLGMIDSTQLHRDASAVLKQLRLNIPTTTQVRRLPIGVQQMVEIAKALSIHAKVLIMDEPTSSLSGAEAQQLFNVVRDLKSRGVSIIYISHRLGEVKELADRVVVLRDGQNAGELTKSEIEHEAMVRLMVGRDISQYYARTQHQPGDEALRVTNLITTANPSHPLNFTIHRGEIVGVAGLVGAGRTEMLRAIFGVDPHLGGEIHIAGKPAAIHSPVDAIQAGLALVPEDRKQQGLLLEMAVRENISLASLKRDSQLGFRSGESERTISAEMTASMRIKTPSDRQIVRYLSGGNQQKVVLGKWLAMRPSVLMLDEPTRGIDVGAKQEIYKPIGRRNE